MKPETKKHKEHVKAHMNFINEAIAEWELKRNLYQDGDEIYEEEVPRIMWNWPKRVVKFFTKLEMRIECLHDEKDNHIGNTLVAVKRGREIARIDYKLADFMPKPAPKTRKKTVKAV
jgi:hypothetical protein